MHFDLNRLIVLAVLPYHQWLLLLGDVLPLGTVVIKYALDFEFIFINFQVATISYVNHHLLTK